MSNLSDILDGIETVLTDGTNGVTSLKVYKHSPDNVNHFPAAIVLFPDEIDVERAFGGNSFLMDVHIVVLVSAGDSPEGWTELIEMIDPTTANKSVIYALRKGPTLNGKADSSWPTWIRGIGRKEWFGGFYFGFDVILSVVKKVA